MAYKVFRLVPLRYARSNGALACAVVEREFKQLL